jgi:hypothetical protein
MDPGMGGAPPGAPPGGGKKPAIDAKPKNVWEAIELLLKKEEQRENKK